MKRIAVLTSGGDAPGMNAAIRSAVRTAIDKGSESFGIHHGYAGLIRDDFVPSGPRNVGGIIQRGGTMLGGTRCRLLATRMGAAATEHIARDEWGVLVGLIEDDIAAKPLANVVGKRKVPDLRLLKLACVLAI